MALTAQMCRPPNISEQVSTHSLYLRQSTTVTRGGGSRDPTYLPGRGGDAHLSVMATCSSMAEPVLDFQLPDMEVLLQRVKHTFALRSQ